VWQFTSDLHCGFDVPLANALQNGVITHEHPPWGNGLVCGKPFLFECHVLRCTRIDNLIIVVWSLALNATINICSWSSQVWLAFFFSSFFVFKQFITKCLGFL
jgi:hypothetical protein